MLNTLALIGFVFGVVALIKGNLWKVKNRKQAIGVLFICFLILGSSGSKDATEESKANEPEVKISTPAPAPAPAMDSAPVDPVVAASAAKEAWLKENFSSWDGSNRNLVKLVKKSLNDPESFEHEETTFNKSNDEFIRVEMVYRAKNAFGALILQNITVKINYKTKEITVISQNI